MKTCFFIGHRDAPDELLPTLEASVERHITEYGVNAFIVGHYGNFDRLAARAVIAAKARHRSVTLHRLLPYRSKDRMEYLPKGFNGVFCPFTEPVDESAAIPIANKYAISHCDYLIAYVCHEGNARGFAEYARARGNIHVENTAE